MPDEPIEIKLDNKAVEEALLEVAKKASDLRPLMKNIAGIMADSTEENFKEEGRPKWKDLSEKTKTARRKTGHYPGQILQVSGQLAMSITTQYDNESAVIGSNTVKEISERYNVSRRTAERMRDSLTCIFPSIDEIETDDTQKHWGFTNYSISNLITFTPKEIANIEQLQRRTTNREMKEELGKTVEKIKSLARKNLNSVEDNIELFMQTEGYAVRQMPK